MSFFTDKELKSSKNITILFITAYIIFILGIMLILSQLEIISIFERFILLLFILVFTIPIYFYTWTYIHGIYTKRIVNTHIQNHETKELVKMLLNKDDHQTVISINALRANGDYDNGNLNGIRILHRCNVSTLNMNSFKLNNAKFNNTVFIQTQLSQTSFKNVVMRICQLDEAIAVEADFSDAYIIQCSLVGINWSRANIKNGSITESNLTNAILNQANLSGVNLQNTGLRHASLIGTTFTEGTQLPDSTEENPIFWTHDTDMTKYTDPNHPNFWEPDYSKTLWELNILRQNQLVTETRRAKVAPRQKD